MSMLPDALPDQRTGWGWAALHVIKRLVLMLIGYLVSVLAALVALVIIFGMLVSLPDAPDYFSAWAMSPLIVLMVPPLAVMAYFIAIIFTIAQTLLVALLAELFVLRALWMHALFGALVGVSGYLMGMQTVVDSVGAWHMADTAIVAASGIVGGLFYWLIAGRDANFRRRP